MQIHKYKYTYKVVLDVTEEGTGQRPSRLLKNLKQKIKTPKFETNANTQIQVQIQAGIGCNSGGNGGTSQQITQRFKNTKMTNYKDKGNGCNREKGELSRQITQTFETNTASQTPKQNTNTQMQVITGYKKGKKQTNWRRSLQLTKQIPPICSF